MGQKAAPVKKESQPLHVCQQSARTGNILENDSIPASPVRMGSTSCQESEIELQE